MYRIVLLILLAGLMSCTGTTFDEAAAREQILEMERLQRKVHFIADASTFAGLLAEPHLSVNRGVVRNTTREENEPRFQGYFDSVHFVEWDDQAEPIIRFSDDGSLAYCVVERRVTVQYPSDEGLYHGTTEYAWTAIYRRTTNGWEVESVTSTNQEPTHDYLRNIVAHAECTSPEGAYTTDLLADHEGFLEFRQAYGYREGGFAAQVQGDSLAQSMDDEGRVGESLEKPVIAMLQGHNFFWMYLQPGLFFKELDTLDPLHWRAKDALDNPVEILRDDHHYQVQQILLRNSLDTSELITINYLQFDSTAFGPLPQELEVVQAGRDTFHFEFTDVALNTDDFPVWKE